MLINAIIPPTPKTHTEQSTIGIVCGSLSIYLHSQYDQVYHLRENLAVDEVIVLSKGQKIWMKFCMEVMLLYGTPKQ
jgi:hypothetical protein